MLTGITRLTLVFIIATIGFLYAAAIIGNLIGQWLAAALPIGYIMR